MHCTGRNVTFWKSGFRAAPHKKLFIPLWLGALCAVCDTMWLVHLRHRMFTHQPLKPASTRALIWLQSVAHLSVAMVTADPLSGDFRLEGATWPLTVVSLLLLFECFKYVFGWWRSEHELDPEPLRGSRVQQPHPWRRYLGSYLRSSEANCFLSSRFPPCCSNSTHQAGGTSSGQWRTGVLISHFMLQTHDVTD